MAATLKLVKQDYTSSPPPTGEEVMRLVGELIADHLPSIPFDDPYRGVLGSLARAR